MKTPEAHPVVDNGLGVGVQHGTAQHSTQKSRE